MSDLQDGDTSAFERQADRQAEGDGGKDQTPSGERRLNFNRAAEAGSGSMRRAEIANSAEAQEPGHGRSAESPAEIPPRGWKDILWRVYAGISDDRVLANAAAVTFYGLLALFPAIGALVSIYGLFADPGTIAKQLDTMNGILPGGAIDVIRDQMTRVASQGGGKLGLSFLLGLAVSLWSANGGIKALFDALNVVYEEKEERSFIRLNAVSLTFTVAMIFFLIIAITCVVAVPVVLAFFPGFVATLVNYARWPAMLVLVALVFACVYRFGPNRATPRWRWISWGSVFAAFAWLAASALFSWYASSFGSFNKTYGSLGAVIGFMTWMWLSVIVILIGGKLNAETEHQTARTSTEGPDKPIGARGAQMADTVGASRG
ncbi:MAG: YihY/virulence factor BrkB family protein [Alphaproteobacteria bacterium]|nr:YihY/virulence factor BrkB family protein [Alphaproteobacteria bacterium]